MIKHLSQNKFVVIDDAVSLPMQDQIKNDFIDSNFPWYLSKSLSTVSREQAAIYSSDSNVCEYLMFVHTFYDNPNGVTIKNSNFTPILDKILNPILTKLELSSVNLLRCKANLQTQHKNNLPNSYNVPHTDMEEDHYVMIYYVNDSDGDTFLFDNNKVITRVTPKKGRALIFNGRILHAGSHPYTSNVRCIVNIDFKV